MKLKQFIANNDNSAFNAAISYLFCQLFIRGIGFVTTPIFSRILSKTEYGIYNNFFAWEGIVFPIITLNLHVSINKSKYDFKDDKDNFLSTILIIADILIVTGMVFVFIFKNLFENILGMPIIYIFSLFIYILFYTAFDFQQIQYNIYKQYKIYVFYSIISIVLNLILSLILVFVLSDKLLGRMIGIIIPTALIGTVIYINVFRKGKKPKVKYAKYALKMSIPLLISALSMTILSTSDRIMITRLAGVEATALYAIAYTVAGIAGIVFSALSQAWSPWLMDNLNTGNFVRIRKKAKQFSVLYFSLIIFIMLIAPEIIRFMGGSSYYEARYAMPSVILAMVFQFFYTFFYDIEYYYGKTYVISIGTLIAAIINLILNYIFIPKYGYIAASYTTLVSYAIMFFYHYLIVRINLKKTMVYPIKLFNVIIVLSCLIQLGIAQIYDNYFIRYFVMLMYMFIMMMILHKLKFHKILFMKFLGKTSDR